MVAALSFSVVLFGHTLEIFIYEKIQGVTYRCIYIKIAVILIVIGLLSQNLSGSSGRSG